MSSMSPTVRSIDPDATIAFLTKAFGLEEGMVHRNEDGSVGHAELWYDDDAVMLGPSGGEATPTASVYVVVADPDAHHDAAVAAGAEIVMPLTDQDYDSRDYGAKDIDGNTWFFGTYRPERPGVSSQADRTRVQVDLIVADVKKAVEFYELLGLDVPELWEQDGVAHHVEVPASSIGFNSRTLTQGYDAAWPDASGVVLMFHVDGRDDVDSAFDKLTGAGYAAHMAPIDAFWGARYAVVDDPDGNHVGIMSSSDRREHESIDL
jgi:uncharacterized glyoxalase superfamily protein PhnB